MEVRRIEMDGVTIAELRGALDVSTAPMVEAELDRWLREGTLRLLVDLSGVERVFSSGLSAMLALHRTCTALGGRIMFAGARPFFREVLRITHLDLVLAMAPDRQAGWEAMAE